jgi:hypothetical protein
MMREPQFDINLRAGQIANGLKPWQATVARVRDCILDAGIFAIADRSGQLSMNPDTLRQVNTEAIRAVKAGRFFDMGHIPNEVFQIESLRAARFYRDKHLIQPFRESWILYHTWEQGSAVYLVTLYENEPLSGGTFSSIELLPVLEGRLLNRKLLVSDRASAKFYPGREAIKE